jgi:hypothetical protein
MCVLLLILAVLLEKLVRRSRSLGRSARCTDCLTKGDNKLKSENRFTAFFPIRLEVVFDGSINVGNGMTLERVCLDG